MGFTVEHDCPQCGAPIEMDETDHLLRCPYCDVKNYLFTHNYFRFILPHRAPDKDIIYAPYLRFRGNVYFIEGFNLNHKVLDITSAGLELKYIPATLGLRPQAMKMKFVTPETKGEFLRFTLQAKDILARAAKMSSGTAKDKILHRAYIGETMSLIYLPLYVDNNKLYDAVLNRPMGNLPDGPGFFETLVNKNPKWKIHFIPTLCPRCGWNLDGEKDSVVLTCGNCDTAWEAAKGKFAQVTLELVPGENNESIYLPFWKTNTKEQGLGINSFADFIRLTNQPRVLGKDWEKEPVSFWSPAFKIRPKIFLNVARQFTISQKHFQTSDIIPKKGLHPVTLPRSEAVQAMKITLAGSAVTKKNIFPYLPQIRFNPQRSTLVYLPFSDNGHEMVQQHVGISINKNSLEFGRKL